jgi:AraC-like DNA-binding protein
MSDDHGFRAAPHLRERIAYFPAAKRAMHYAEARLGGTVRLADAAAAAGMNASAFSRYFTLKVGIPFSHALRALRIERAVDRLYRSDVSISTLSEIAGYSSPNAFARAFKNVTGRTPTEFRASICGAPTE